MENGGQGVFEGVKMAQLSLRGVEKEASKTRKARLFDALTPCGASSVPGTCVWGRKAGGQRGLKVLQSGIYMTAIPALPSRPCRTEVIGGRNPGPQGRRSGRRNL